MRPIFPKIPEIQQSADGLKFVLRNQESVDSERAIISRFGSVVNFDQYGCD